MPRCAPRIGSFTFLTLRGEMSTNIGERPLFRPDHAALSAGPYEVLSRTKALAPANASRPPAELALIACRRRCCHRLDLDDFDHPEPHVRAVLRVLLVEIVQPETPQPDVHRIDARPAEAMEAAHGRDGRRRESLEPLAHFKSRLCWPVRLAEGRSQ